MGCLAGVTTEDTFFRMIEAELPNRAIDLFMRLSDVAEVRYFSSYVTSLHITSRVKTKCLFPILLQQEDNTRLKAEAFGNISRLYLKQNE